MRPMRRGPTIHCCPCPLFIACGSYTHTLSINGHTLLSFTDDFHFANDHQFLNEFHSMLRFQSELQEKGQLCLHSNLRQIKEKEVTPTPGG